MTTEKKAKSSIALPMGRLSYPYLLAPDTGREYSTGKYSLDLMIDKATWERDSKPFRELLLRTARVYHNKPAAKLSDFRVPFRDMDASDKTPESKKGMIGVRVKSPSQPALVDGKKNPLTPEQAKALLVEGAYVNVQVTVAGYKQKPDGVTAFLDAVQFVKPGESFGEGGRELLFGEISDIEVGADSVSGDDDIEVNI